MRISNLSPIVGLFVAGTVAANSPRCPAVDVPPASACVATASGLAYADTPAEAQVAARALDDTAQRFSGHFGRAPMGMLVLSTSLDANVAQAFAKSHGLEFAKVWLPAEAKQAMTERAMRKAGMDRARIRQALDSVTADQEITLRHEAGHAMYAAMYWRDAPLAPGGRYGTPAPDWLDEAVAIGMEPSASQARYLAAFIDVARVRPREVPGLRDFLASEHPVRSAALARALARGPKSGSGVQMVVTSNSRRFTGVDTFYGQSLLTALFLAETSGDARILAPISAAIAGGVDFDAWLASDGMRYNLPTTVSALEPLWQEWLQQQVLQRTRAGSR